MAFNPLRLAILCAAMALALTSATAAAAQELLHNGGFEQGTSGWNGLGISTAGCTPLAGNAALAVPAFLQQNLPSPIGSGAYTLQGSMKAKSGSAAAEIALIWFDGAGSELPASSKDVAIGADYTPFSVTAAAPSTARGLRVRITAEGGTICLDALSLDGPPAAPPATATSPPSQQSSSSASATPKASATPRPTATAQPTSVPAATEPAPVFEFINGGFEDGLRGWGKFGGTLGLVDSPVQSGVHAGQLTSSTDSTKWAYQTILVDTSHFYEFGGYLSSGAGVSRAYLRISWYASADGSGAALATADSTRTVTGTGDGYVYLSTGPVAPPGGAHSARTRVVMTPLSAGAASISFDDLWFGVVAPPAATAPESEPAGAASVAAADVTSSRRTNEAPGIDSGAQGRATEVRNAAAPAATADSHPAGPLSLAQDADSGVPLIWLGGALLFVVGVSGSYLQARRRSS